jgi:hypothetical protein
VPLPLRVLLQVLARPSPLRHLLPSPRHLLLNPRHLLLNPRHLLPSLRLQRLLLPPPLSPRLLLLLLLLLVLVARLLAREAERARAKVWRRRRRRQLPHRPLPLHLPPLLLVEREARVATPPRRPLLASPRQSLLLLLLLLHLHQRQHQRQHQHQHQLRQPPLTHPRRAGCRRGGVASRAVTSMHSHVHDDCTHHRHRHDQEQKQQRQPKRDTHSIVQ